MNPATSSLLDSAQSQLVLVDVQEKLCAAMPAAALEVVLRQCSILLQVASWLQIPVLCTEQYPQGLGHTHTHLQPYLSRVPVVEKTRFSCCGVPAFDACLSVDRPQVLLMGMEAHICILQTALQLQESGKQVFVIEDATLSRHAEHQHQAMARLRQAGVIVSHTETTAFEWLRVAGGEHFKNISRLLR